MVEAERLGWQRRRLRMRVDVEPRVVFDGGAAGAELDVGLSDINEALVHIVVAVVRKRLEALDVEVAVAGLGARVALRLVVVIAAVEGPARE